ncbi:MAG TPA: hypothetical protein VMV02_07970 [Acidimicrobiales bacterium]|nr:hypothetical protein [Acidimicrobiales bacterium]
MAHAMSLHFMSYNFCRAHESLTITDEKGKRIKRTPALAAGLATSPWSLTQLAGLLD